MDLLSYHVAALDDRHTDLLQSEQNWDRRAAEVSQFGLADDDFALDWLARHIELAGKEVLDVSFGAGRYLQAFLQRGARIGGVEISACMIAHARARLDQCGLAYAPERLLHSSWEALDLAAHCWENAFDLVFLYFSPAISSVAMLEKVLAASRQGIYVSLYCQREDGLLSALQDEFGLPRRSVGADTADDLQHICNILYLWGYFPHITFEERRKTSAHAVDYIFERYASWLFKGQSADAAHRGRLQQALARRSVDGKITTTSRDIVGHLYLDKRLGRTAG
jgi:SAM-dependent methyltransferase